MSFGFDSPENLWLCLLLIPAMATAWVSRRQMGGVQFFTTALLRMMALLCFFMALAGLTRFEQAKALAVVYVLDKSASVPEESSQRAEAIIVEGLKSQGRKDVAGLVVFGDDALIEHSLKKNLRINRIESTPNPHQSDLESAIRLGSALMPADRSRRLVILSDGEETRGDAKAEAQFVVSQDLEITVAPLESNSGDDMRIEEIRAPAEVQQGAPFQLQALIESDVPSTGVLRLYKNEQYLGEIAVDLTQSQSATVRVEQEAREAGLIRYRAVLSPDDPDLDAISANNEYSATVQISGPKRVLIISSRSDKGLHLASTLKTEKLRIENGGIDYLPGTIGGLRDYSVLILDNVPAYALTRPQQEAIRTYVRDMGRGLVMIGGDRSFGLGGYYHSPVADAMPVHMDIKDKTKIPKLGMILALDKSCSMGGGAGSKLAMAKEAAIETANILSDRDMLGVISFDGAASWIVRLNSLENRDQIIEKIASLRSGGGTDIYPALKTSTETLAASDAALKHIVLLSDGMTTPGDYQSLLSQAQANKITLTSIAIGDDADRNTMSQLAEWGGGNYYLVTDPLSIPAVFTREAMLATRAFLIEERLKPNGANPSDILIGLKPSKLPAVNGLVATQVKDRATLALTVNESKQGELPLLAHWNYGVGRSVAWTSDATSQWSKEWLEKGEYDQLWTQIVRWASGGDSPSHLVVSSRIEDGQLEIEVDAFDANGSFQNFLRGEARVIAPDLSVRPLELQQVGPGQYRAFTTADQIGSWLVGVALYEGENLVGKAVSEAVQPYSPEYRTNGDGAALMQSIGSLGMGGVLASPGEAFARPEEAREIPYPVWPWLVVIGSLLFLADIAARRLEWSQPAVAKVTAQSRQQKQKTRKPTQRANRESTETPVDVPSDRTDEQAEITNAYASRLLAARKQARRKLGEDE